MTDWDSVEGSRKDFRRATTNQILDLETRDHLQSFKKGAYEDFLSQAKGTDGLLGPHPKRPEDLKVFRIVLLDPGRMNAVLERVPKIALSDQTLKDTITVSTCGSAKPC
eukprot:3717711-Rhodomonas_salina.1